MATCPDCLGDTFEAGGVQWCNTPTCKRTIVRERTDNKDTGRDTADSVDDSSVPGNNRSSQQSIQETWAKRWDQVDGEE